MIPALQELRNKKANVAFSHLNKQDDLYSSRPITFSYTDCNAGIILPFTSPGDSEFIELPGVSLISLSTHRDVFPVVASGTRGVRGYTMGHSTKAGSIGFTLFGESPWLTVIKTYCRWIGMDTNPAHISPDELPPMYLNLVFFNENGDYSRIVVRGLKILDSSKNISIRDVQLTELYSFIATDITQFSNEQKSYSTTMAEDLALVKDIEKSKLQQYYQNDTSIPINNSLVDDLSILTDTVPYDRQTATNVSENSGLNSTGFFDIKGVPGI